MIGIVSYTENGYAMQQAIAAAGQQLWCQNGIWYGDDATTVQAIISGWNPLPTEQAAAIAAVEATLAAKIAAGFTYNGTTIGIAPADIVNINSMASQALLTLSPPAGVTPAAWPAGFAWLPQGAGTPIPLSAAEMLSMANACAHYVSALILYADALAAEIEAATTSAAVTAVLTNANWPTS
jgi:hypothetical protein